MHIEELLDTMLTDEPVSTIDTKHIVAKARHRRAARLTVTASALLIIVGGAVVLADTTHESSSKLPSATSRLQLAAVVRAGHLATQPAANISAIASSSSQTRRAGSAAETGIADIVKRVTGAKLTELRVFTLSPYKSLNLSAGITARAGRGSVDIQVYPAGDAVKGAPQCAELDDLARGGDGYSGPCNVQHVDGGYLVQRFGVTSTGGFTKVSVSLIASDGSAVLAEVTNQAGVAVDRNGVREQHGTPPVVQKDPPISSDVLTQLVLRLHRDPPAH